MAKEYYKTKIIGIGGEVQRFLDVTKMVVLFDDSMVFPELREFSVLHSGNKLDGKIKPGDVLKIADSEFRIVKIGNDVQNNLKNLGHIVVKFDNGAGDLLEGSVHVEDKPIPHIRPGDEITIYESSGSLIGKKVVVIGSGDVKEAVEHALHEGGAAIVEEGEEHDFTLTIS